MENDKRFNGKAIYNPSGKAGEYSQWACNFFTGCSNDCEYCYCKRGIMSSNWSNKPRLKSCFRDKKHAIEIFEKELLKNLDELQEYGLFFSFTTDPLIFETYNLTIEAICFCFRNGVPVKVLTKCVDYIGQLRYAIEVNEWDKTEIAIGFTLTGHDELEPNASPNSERIEAMKKLHKAGFKTWASIEPIIDFESSFEMIEKTIGFCDLYKIGLMSGKKYETNVLRSFIQRVNKACMFGTTDTYKPKIYWKNSITDVTGKYMIESGFNVDRNYNLFQ